VQATVYHDERYGDAELQAQIEDALLAAFSFEQRSFGQPVTAAGVIGVVHQVDGVVAVDLDTLTVAGGGQRWLRKPRRRQRIRSDSVLPALTARRTNGDILPAQLLLIDEAGIELTMKAAP
jgi:hypothetical protein